MSRIFNFCAGPATLPLPVLEKAREEFLDYRGLGMSIMEISHRSSHFDEMADATEACLRRLLDISDDYAVLFLQGGAQMRVFGDDYETRDGTGERDRGSSDSLARLGDLYGLGERVHIMNVDYVLHFIAVFFRVVCQVHEGLVLQFLFATCILNQT